MRTAAMLLMTCVVSLPGICIAGEPAGTHSVNDSVHTEPLVHQDTKTRLQLTIATPLAACRA